MLGAGVRLDRVGHAVRLQRLQRLRESGDDVLGDERVVLGESEIELGLDAVREQVGGIVLVGDDAHAVERGDRAEALGEDSGGGDHVAPAHAVADGAGGAIHDGIGVEVVEPGGGITHDLGGVERAAGGEHALNLLAALGEVEAQLALAVEHVREQAEVALGGDAAGEIAQLVAHAHHVHVEDDGREGTIAVGVDGEALDDAVGGGDLDLELVHG